MDVIKKCTRCKLKGDHLTVCARHIFLLENVAQFPKENDVSPEPHWAITSKTCPDLRRETLKLSLKDYDSGHVEIHGCRHRAVHRFSKANMPYLIVYPGCE